MEIALVDSDKTFKVLIIFVFVFHYHFQRQKQPLFEIISIKVLLRII